MKRSGIVFGSALAGVLFIVVFVGAQDKGPMEQERSVKESEVPAAPLAALKKLAGAAPFTEFAEEIEHGHKFYEGSWKGPDGNIDALVTESGDLVEIEESTLAEKVPGPARSTAEKEAGQDAKLSWERKTMVLYEVHYKKDGKTRELLLTPDGRPYVEGGNGKQGQDDDKEEDK